tara:strand:+ start:41 stop:298 length:258 start_codon:yes stop_codon:yes gene_type:complete
MAKGKVLRKCSVCKAIEINGDTIAEADYDQRFFEKLGYIFTDTYLSRECFFNFNRDGFIRIDEEDLLEELSSGYKRVSCSSNHIS